MKLETKRLILRAPGKRDITNIVAGLNDFQVSRYLSKVPYPYKKKDAEWWINDCAKKFRKKKKEAYQFNIELKSERKLIGGIGLLDISYFNNSAEIGYWVNENYWKQGIITEALVKLIDFAGKELKLNRLVINAYPGNAASNAVAKKFGFKFEGVAREAHNSLSSNKIYDGNVYSMLRREWPKAKKRLKKK